MTLKLVYYPDPHLREVSAPVGKDELSRLREIAPQMFAVMYRHRGVGLAGPQVGLLKRIVVANITGDRENAAEERVFINPEIKKKSGSMHEIEGCLSLPGLGAKVRRAASVKVAFFDLDGEAWEMECEGLYAKLFQHEIDHLDGVLMIDKISAADLRQAKPLLRELEEDFKEKRDPRRRRDAVTSSAAPEKPAEL